MTPAVPLLDPDPYNGTSKLRFDNASQDMDADIISPSPEAKKQHNQVKYSKEYVPPEATPSPIVKETPGLRRSKWIAEKQAETRKANRTSWIPSRIGKLYTVATGMIGILFLPMHSQAMPSRLWYYKLLISI